MYLMNQDLAMEAPPTRSQRKDMVGACAQSVFRSLQPEVRGSLGFAFPTL